MSEKIQEFLEIPQEFIREGNQVRHFCPRNSIGFSHHPLPPSFLSGVPNPLKKVFALCCSAKPEHSLNVFLQLEFVQISKAVAIGFAVMGFIGYLVKLIHIPM